MRNPGFTLVELAVALLIIGILLASALIPLSTQIEVRSVADTQRSLEQIREAIIGYAQATGRLPCPADPTLATGAAGAGTERASCNTGTDMFGVVPWATLGTPEFDAWGHRFSYRVAYVFADAIADATYASAGQPVTCTPPTNPTIPAPTLASFTLCSQGDITVNTRKEADPSAHSETALASNQAAVIVSHGRNGYGAYTARGTKDAVAQTDANGDGVPDTNTDETANASPNSTTFYSRPPTRDPTSYFGIGAACSDAPSGSSPFCEFDDIVVWISPSTLVARMVSAGRLP